MTEITHSHRQATRLGERLRSVLDRFGLLALAVVLAIFALAEVRFLFVPFWYDEMYTYGLATAANWHLFAAGLAGDGNPPLYALAARASVHLFGANEGAVRLPALLGFLGACVFVYGFVRRRADAMTAVFAAAVLASNPFANHYATEARPYGFVLLFAAMGVFGWQGAAEDGAALRWRWIGLVLLTAGVAGSVLSHHMAVMGIGLALLVGEGTRTIVRRRIDWGVTVAALTGLLPLLYTTRLMHATFQLTKHHAMVSLPMTLQELMKGYGQHLKVTLLVPMALMTLALLLVRRWWPESITLTGSRWSSYEIAAGMALLCSLGFVFAVVRVTTGYYAGPRYGIGVAIGAALLLGALVSLYAAEMRLVVLVVIVALLAHRTMFVAKHYPQHPSLKDPLETMLERVPGDEPIVIARGLLFPPAYHYADVALQERLFYVVGAEFDRRGTYWLEDMAVTPKEVAPPHMVNYREFLARGGRFYYAADLQGRPDEADFELYLRQHGYRFEPIAETRGNVPTTLRLVDPPLGPNGAEKTAGRE